MEKSTRLGQILLEKGLLTTVQLDIAINEQTKRRQHINFIEGNLSVNSSLGEILIELGFISRLQLKRGLSWQMVLRKVAIIMSFCAPLMTATYSATAAAFTPPGFSRSSASSEESQPTPTFTRTFSSSSSEPSNNSTNTSDTSHSNNLNVSSSSSKSSAVPNKVSGPDLIAPQMPATIAVTAALYNRVHLSWIAATDNVGVTRYRIYRDQVQIDILDGSKTEFIDFNVAPGKTYLYGISAGDSVGNWSAIKSLFIQTSVAPQGVAVSSASSVPNSSVTSSSAASSTPAIASSSSSKAPTFTPSSSSSSAPPKLTSSSVSSISSAAISSVASSSSSKAASSSSSSATSSASSSASSLAGPVNLNWAPPVARENGDTLDITEVGGYELRYRKVADSAYTYVTIDSAWTNTHSFSWLEGSYVFQIAAFDKNGLYSNFIDLTPK